MNAYDNGPFQRGYLIFSYLAQFFLAPLNAPITSEVPNGQPVKQRHLVGVKIADLPCGGHVMKYFFMNHFLTISLFLILAHRINDYLDVVRLCCEWGGHDNTVLPQVKGGRDIGSNGVSLDGTMSLDCLTLCEGDNKAYKEIVTGL